MSIEIWKEIPGYEGYYEVSNYGRVRSMERVIHDKLRPRKMPSKILKFGIDGKGKGYRHCLLYMNGMNKTYKVHRLVALAFIPNPQNYPIVNHKDENPANNRVENLEWCTNQYNCTYGTIEERRGTKVAKYSKSGEFIEKYISVRSAARANGINETGIFHSIQRGHCCGGYKWAYL